MQLSQHFTLDELTRSDYAIRHGIDNTPSAEVLANIGMLAAGLEGVRAVLAVPVHVSSGYRCAKLNSAIGGSKSSAHMQGLAADFTCPQFGTPADVARVLVESKLRIGFDQLILEGRWVHVSFSDEPRYEVLTAHFGNGPTTYTKGIA
ncbi:MAG: peptidase M15 [Gammaproteobacteria bacterium RIFCSPHIGHO2_12_FULL_63_22]|nr:MAG: peptidase M15 [Gammaproteobacteria bacterium RIFCSPHIGHO2_12_FULL_63_22]